MSKKIAEMTLEELANIDVRHLSLYELDEYNKVVDSKFSEDDKEEAWRQMNTLIYDKDGNIIGDKYAEEDAYEE